MDLYDENFKIQDMIESDMRDADIRDMRCDFDVFLSSNMPSSPGSPSLTALTPVVPMDVMNSALDCDLSNDCETGWMNSSHMYNLNGDLDSSVGLLVNPQTALPISVSQPSVTLSTTAVITSNPSSKEGITVVKSIGCQTATPVRVTSATLVSPQVVLLDQEESTDQVTVRTPSQNLHDSEQHVELEPKSPKAKVKSKQNSKLSQQVFQENTYPKPLYSYSCLIAMALKNSRNGCLPVNEIYDFMTENFPYFKTAPNGWKNSVRHNLSLNKCFEKIEKPSGSGSQRKGYLWTMNPARVEKMEEELQKWGSKDPEAIRKSMANPEHLELIEKGELNHLICNIQQTIHAAATEKMENQETPSVHSTEEKTIQSINGELSNDCFSPMDETVSMDSSLPELDIKKGIWENLCEDRLQFLGDSPINSSPKDSSNLCTASVIMDENSSPVSSPSTMPKSFIHANYIYTFTQCTPPTDSADSPQLLQHSSVTSTSEKSMICDA